MGCGDSSLVQQTDGPYPNDKNNSLLFTKAIIKMTKNNEGANKFNQQNSEQLRLAQQQIIAAYDRAKGNIQVLFDELSERISQYYMSLSGQVIELMSQHKLSQLQTKIYLSEQILLLYLDALKAVGLKTNYQFPIDIFKIFNKAQSVLIDYLKQKYPRAGNVFIPGDLNGVFKSFDMVENSENDMLRNSGFCFTDSSNPQIIRKLKILFNSLIDQIDSKFPIFKKFLQQKIFSYELEGKKKMMNYKIGRKLPQNTGKYQPDEVDSLTINSPQLFRMIIKWVGDMEQFLISTEQEVNEKTSFKYYNTYKDEIFFDEVTPQECETLDEELKKNLKQLYQPYNKQIKNLLRQMDMFNFNLLKILYTTERKQKFVPKSEAFVIKYAMHNTKLVSWLLTQKLILVIKNLINVGKQMQKTIVNKKLDLVKFNVTDLLRAMVVGSKKQILMVYQKIKKLQKEGEMKIVKMKNRLGTPLNDVMIIFTFKGSFLVCQLQLVLSEGEGVSEKLKNIQFLNHFLYELVRSPYGILSQVAILLGFKDNKINYEDKISFENKEFEDFVICAQKHPQTIITELIQLKPFICTQCTEFYQPLQNIFGYKKCEKCFIYQCCKCSFNKHRDLEDFHINQRFNSQLICDIAGDRNKKSIFQTASKDVGIQSIMKCFHNKKFFFKNLFKKHYQKLIPKDIYSFIKRRNFQTPELESSSNTYFLLVQFKGENTTIKCYFWNSIIQQIQNCFKPQQIFMQNEKISSSYYDFIIFFNADNIQDAKPQAEEKIIKLCLKPETSIANIKNFKAIKIITKKKEISAFLIIRFEGIKTNKIQGTQILQQQMLTKKQFMYSSIEQARKSLPEVAIIKQIFQMKNFGITTPLLKYFQTYPQKTKLKTINLNNNKLTQISIILKQCVNAENILVGKNFIKQVKIVTPLKNLLKLFLFHNKLVNISGLQNAPSLKKLNLQQNNLKKLDPIKLNKLNQLIISSNQFQNLNWLQKSILPEVDNISMQSIDKTFSQTNEREYTFDLPKLKKLAFQQNKLKSLSLKSPELTYLDCSECSLSFLRFDSKNVQYLKITGNKLQNLGQILESKCQKMKHLFAESSGTLSKIPKINSDSLEYLSLSSCNIEDTANLQLSKLPQLRQINLNYNLFSQLPQFNLINLKLFELQGVYLKDLTQASHLYLPSLGQLSLSGDNQVQFAEFPKLILHSLKSLRLERFKFKDMENFSNVNLPVLQNLYLTEIKSNNFPILNFHKLLSFEITTCNFLNLSGLQKSIFSNLLTLSITGLNSQLENPISQSYLRQFNSPKLNICYISNSKFFIIEKFFNQKPHLQKLTIHYCKCQNLPIFQLPTISELSIGYSQVKNIQNLMLSKLQKLVTLDLNLNQITKVPKLSMPSLKDLQLSNNKIIQIDDLKQNNLPNLEQINLTNNLLTEFPGLKLKTLKRLSLLQNPLQKLDGLTRGKINNLQKFSISNCTNLKATALPKLDFPKVSTIQIINCNITSLDNLEKSNLPSLQTIFLQQLQVVSMPILRLSNLTTFTMSCSSPYSTQKKPALKDLSKMSKWQCPRLETIILNYSEAENFPNLKLEKLVKLEFESNKFKDTSNLKISQLPELDDINFRQNPNLAYIDIPYSCLLQSVNYSECKLETMTDFSGFKSQNLYLNKSGIKQISSMNLTETEYLSLEDNSLQDICGFIIEVPKLQSLYISNNQIRQLPKVQFPLLTNLIAQNNKIQSICIEAKLFPQLNYLNLEENCIERIVQISSPNLTTINLKKNKIKILDCFKVPFEGTMSQLSLEDNQITKIQALPACSNIYLGNNQLTDLNWVCLSKPQSWSYVSIEFNKLKDVSGLNNKNNKFTNLYYLTLNDNQITSIDISSVCFKSLQTLLLNNNKISVVDNMTDASLPALYQLQINANNIKKVGPTVSLSALTRLGLGNNPLEGIDGLNCKQLTDLQLNECKLSSLNWVNKIKCPALATLNVRNNQITALPKLTAIPKLRQLHMEGNRLQTVTEFMNSSFQNAKQLNLTYAIKQQLQTGHKNRIKKQLLQFVSDSSVCENVELLEQGHQSNQVQYQLPIEPLDLQKDA